MNKESSLGYKLKPTIDNDGILHVGGRLHNANLEINYRNTIILPGGKHPVSILLIRHYHHLAKHQGRHFTDGVIRSAGVWIVGAKQSVSYTISHCVTCRKMTRKPEHQIIDHR